MDLITIANKFGEKYDHGKNNLVFGTIEIQDYFQIYNKIAYCLYSDVERIISNETQQLTVENKNIILIKILKDSSYQCLPK